MTNLAQLRQFTFQLAEEVQQGLQHVIPVAELAPNFLSIFRRPPPKIAHECSAHRVDVSEPALIRHAPCRLQSGRFDKFRRSHLSFTPRHA